MRKTSDFSPPRFNSENSVDKLLDDPVLLELSIYRSDFKFHTLKQNSKSHDFDPQGYSQHIYTRTHIAANINTNPTKGHHHSTKKVPERQLKALVLVMQTRAATHPTMTGAVFNFPIIICQHAIYYSRVSKSSVY